MSNETLRDITKKDLDSTRGRFHVQPHDGLLITAIKCLGGPYQLWHRILMRFIVPILSNILGTVIIPMFSMVAPLLGVMENRADAIKFASRFRASPQSQRNAALDLYIFLWTAVVSIAYGVAHSWSLSWSSSNMARMLIFVCVVLGAWRLYEIWIFLIALHSTAKYSTPAKMRAILNTLWHYLEATIIFALFYVSVHSSFGDLFSSTTPSRFNDCSFTPLYFSFVTITTLGYGDHSPQSWIGKALVCLEVATGIFLFVVVLQRAISSIDNSESGDGKQQ